MKRWGVLASCLLVSAVWSRHVNADSFFMNDITWENAKTELSRLNDWSLGIRRIPKGAKPEIIVNDGRITFNGEVLKFGDDISVWKKIIGGIPREMPRQDLYIWDELGIKVGVGWDGRQKVLFLDVIFHCKERGSSPVCPENGGPGNEYEPKNFFVGYLEYEGGPIDSRSTVLEANRLIKGAANFGGGCGLGLCSVVRGKYGYVLSSPDVQGKNSESMIYGVSFEDDVFKEYREAQGNASEDTPDVHNFQLNEITWESATQELKDLQDWAANLRVISEKEDSGLVVEDSNGEKGVAQQ